VAPRRGVRTGDTYTRVVTIGGISGAVLSLVLTSTIGVAAAPAPFSRSVLTADDSRYRFVSKDDGTLVVRAPRSNPAANRREVFSRPRAPVGRDQTTCATWVRHSDALVQEGLAVRIVDRRDRVRAITLTKNTVFGVDWVFNVLTWDTRRNGDPWRTVEQFDMGGAVGTPELGVEPLPWRVCLRATGRTIAFRVWLPGRMAPPAWDDPTYARSTTVPTSFNRVGSPGWYVGHIPPGGKVVYDDLTARVH